MLTFAWLAAGCSAPLVVPPGQPRDFDASCAPQGVRACKSACTDGRADACLVVAYAYHEGSGGLPMDHAARNRWEERACDLGSARGCGWLSRSLAEEGLLQDEERAALLRAKACDGGDPTVCVRASRDAFDAEDLELGFARVERACAGREWAGCSALGDLHLYGIGTDRDAAAAEKAYRLACEHEIEPACVNLDGRGTWLVAPIARMKAVYSPDPPMEQLVALGSALPTAVLLSMCVDASGRAVDVRVRERSSEPEIDALAIDTVRTWRFEVDRLPENARVCTTIEFQLRKK